MVWSVIGAAVAAGVVWSFLPEPIPVDLATVTQGPLKVIVEDEGRTRTRDIYVVSAPVAGRLSRVTLRAGDPVEAGQTVVAQFQPTAPAFLDARARAQAQAAVSAAQAARNASAASVREAQAQVEHAARELRRIEGLGQRGLVAQTQVEEARLLHRTATANLDAARAAQSVRDYELQNARSLVADYPSRDDDEFGPVVALRAPVSGRVLRIRQQSETVVPPGTPILELGDPSRLEVAADLLSTDAVKIGEGASAVITEWGGERDLMARVRRIEPSGFTKISALGVEEQRVTVILDVVSPRTEWERLGDGFRVNAAITVWEKDNAVRIPQAALFRDGSDWAAFVVRDGRAVVTRLQIGRSNDRDAELLGGLAAGTRVVIHPSDRVRDGVKIVERTS
jgi:HlyD family secretion protein